MRRSVRCAGLIVLPPARYLGGPYSEDMGGTAVKYSVESGGANVKIMIAKVGSKQADLMKELNECAEGRCSCPTDQYAKVESIQIAPGEDHLHITLKAKPGETIDQGDIKKCLEHTTEKVQRSGGHLSGRLAARSGDSVSR